MGIILAGSGAGIDVGYSADLPVDKSKDGINSWNINERTVGDNVEVELSLETNTPIAMKFLHHVNALLTERSYEKITLGAKLDMENPTYSIRIPNNNVVEVREIYTTAVNCFELEPVQINAIEA